VLWEPDPLTDALGNPDPVKSPVNDWILPVTDTVLEWTEVIVWVIVRISDRVPVEVTDAVVVLESLVVLEGPVDLETDGDTDEVRVANAERLPVPNAVLVLDTRLLTGAVAVKLLVLDPNPLFDTDMVPVLDLDAREAVFDILIVFQEDRLADLV